MEAIIFDLDDTLIHSGIDFKKMKSKIINFLESIGVTCGLLNENMLNLEIIGAAVNDLRSKNASEERVREVIYKVNEIMNDVELESLNLSKPMDGTIEILKHLKDEGFKVGIVTNGCRKYAEKVLEKFSLSKYVDALVARDDVENPKPNPEHLLHILNILNVPVEKAVFVGDHWIDAVCAQNANVKFILVRNRKWDFKKLEKSSHLIVNNISELAELI